MNRADVKSGENKLLAYYWFQQRGRIITNEYLVKWFIFCDRLTKNRTDDTGVLISDRFFKFAEGYICTDQRFSYRFIDRIILKGFRELITLFELLIDNDPRFEIKKNSMKEYSEAYSRYCRREWETAKELFQKIYQESGIWIRYRIGYGKKM